MGRPLVRGLPLLQKLSPSRPGEPFGLPTEPDMLRAWLSPSLRPLDFMLPPASPACNLLEAVARESALAAPPLRPMSAMCCRSWLTVSPPLRAISRCSPSLIAAKPRPEPLERLLPSRRSAALDCLLEPEPGFCFAILLLLADTGVIRGNSIRPATLATPAREVINISRNAGGRSPKVALDEAVE
jgi:hypothetical protein